VCTSWYGNLTHGFIFIMASRSSYTDRSFGHGFAASEASPYIQSVFRPDKYVERMPDYNPRYSLVKQNLLLSEKTSIGVETYIIVRWQATRNQIELRYYDPAAGCTAHREFINFASNLTNDFREGRLVGGYVTVSSPTISAGALTLNGDVDVVTTFVSPELRLIDGSEILQFINNPWSCRIGMKLQDGAVAIAPPKGVVPYRPLETSAIFTGMGDAMVMEFNDTTAGGTDPVFDWSACPAAGVYFFDTNRVAGSLPPNLTGLMEISIAAAVESDVADATGGNITLQVTEETTNALGAQALVVHTKVFYIPELYNATPDTRIVTWKTSFDGDVVRVRASLNANTQNIIQPTGAYDAYVNITWPTAFSRGSEEPVTVFRLYGMDVGLKYIVKGSFNWELIPGPTLYRNVQLTNTVGDLEEMKFLDEMMSDLGRFDLSLVYGMSEYYRQRDAVKFDKDRLNAIGAASGFWSKIKKAVKSVKQAVPVPVKAAITSYIASKNPVAGAIAEQAFAASEDEDPEYRHGFASSPGEDYPGMEEYDDDDEPLGEELQEEGYGVNNSLEELANALKSGALSVPDFVRITGEKERMTRAEPARTERDFEVTVRLPQYTASIQRVQPEPVGFTRSACLSWVQAASRMGEANRYLSVARPDGFLPAGYWNGTAPRVSFSGNVASGELSAPEVPINMAKFPMVVKKGAEVGITPTDLALSTKPIFSASESSDVTSYTLVEVVVHGKPMRCYIYSAIDNPEVIQFAALEMANFSGGADELYLTIHPHWSKVSGISFLGALGLALIKAKVLGVMVSAGLANPTPDSKLSGVTYADDKASFIYKTGGGLGAVCPVEGQGSQLISLAEWLAGTYEVLKSAAAVVRVDTFAELLAVVSYHRPSLLKKKAASRRVAASKGALSMADVLASRQVDVVDHVANHAKWVSDNGALEAHLKSLESRLRPQAEMLGGQRLLGFDNALKGARNKIQTAKEIMEKNPATATWKTKGGGVASWKTTTLPIYGDVWDIGKTLEAYATVGGKKKKRTLEGLG